MDVHESINITYRRHLHDSGSGQYITTIARSTLIRFSSNAARHLPANPQHRNFGVGTAAPKSAVLHVLKWMIDQADVKSPAPLPHPDTFEEAVWALQICRAIGIFKVFMGEMMRDEIKAYMRMAPLTWQEFAMICEVVPYDTQLVRLAVAVTERRFREEGLRGVPDVRKIVEYCLENGIVISIGRYEVDSTCDEAMDAEIPANPGKTGDDQLLGVSGDSAEAPANGRTVKDDNGNTQVREPTW